MSERVSLDDLRAVNKPLYQRLVRMVESKGVDLERVGDLIVDPDAGYHDAAMTELQSYVRTEVWKSYQSMLRQQRETEKYFGKMMKPKAEVQKQPDLSTLGGRIRAKLQQNS